MSTPITAALVNDLRKRTDMPMMECKSALQEADGDIEKAIEIIRMRNSKVSGKRAMNETAEGRIAVYIDAAKEIATILEMRCESAPVVKSDQFQALCNDIAKVVADQNPATVEELIGLKTDAGLTVTDRINEVIGLIRENMKVQRFARFTGGSFAEYIHHDGSVGALLQVSGPADAATLRSICMHITAVQPTPIALNADGVPAELLAKEKALAVAKAEATGKPANIAEKIAEGQMKSWLAENVLLDQQFVISPDKTVGQLIQSLGVQASGFARFKVGEVTV
ncbi:MAG: translation elongation factor Ts [Zavarzinella sp.]